ncbi:5'/3'-nucleotidase SurE [Erythrobacteraceae bacterium CFH 75059]|uniref:5'/3'-nucleotidase SurE n=1 Tax=Qipengyuania thermophila TaxID=2509361 RepID=UPI00101EF38D|nr:5'/3'-nucleotidase SurE [Qipengyuania thermophila]TCD04123.1 5'/3'-nucleotidase SurE [Erythrobacteraceae bacterium CFH 75059]
MRILVTNDDGIHAPGLAVLEELAARFSDDVWICAPAEEQSGMGHALTLSAPVRLRKHGERRFSVTGTPTDAVNLGLRKVIPGRPDVVLSGVNRGANLGDDVTYSGTVSAAIEGALAGVRAIALSQVLAPDSANGNGDPFAASRAWGERVLAPLLDAPLPSRTLVNVNFPPLAPERVRGVRPTRQGFHDYARGSVVEGRDPRGRPYYWFGLEPIEHTPDHGSDLEAVADGWVSVTPLHLDLTHYASMQALADRYGG